MAVVVSAVLFWMSGCLIADAQTASVQELVSFDWFEDGQPFTFELSTQQEDRRLDRFRILRGGREVLCIQDEACFDDPHRLPSPGLAKLLQRNRLKSNYLLAEFVRGVSPHPLLILFGWGYASSPGSLRILALTANGLPQIIFHEAQFELVDLVDLDRDGIPELIGYRCMSEEWGPGLLTYVPLLVYSFPSDATKRMRYREDLSEDYNRRSHYGWAGKECREDLAVVLKPPNGGKPVILPVKDATTLLGLK